MNKKLIIAAVVVVVFAVGITYLIKADISVRNPWLDGEIDQARRGDLVIPVTATGAIEPARLIMIKSKASGEVAKIHVVEGQMVKAGEMLVELDPVDERRNVESRQADLDRATSALEKMKVALENFEHDLPLQTKEAEARLTDAKARYAEAEFRWNVIKGYIEKDVAGNVEAVTMRATYEAAKAATELAEAGLSRAKNNEQILLRSAREDVRQAEATVRSAQKAMDESTQRLAETTVRTRSDGMVYSIMIREGEMIQSGTMSLTGGTPLMILADVNSMFVMAQIDEADIGAIRDIAPTYARPGKTQKLDEAQYRRQAEMVVWSASNTDKPADAGTDASTTSAPSTQNAADVPSGADEKPLPGLVREMVGLPVDVTVEAYRTQTYKGVIERILPEPQRVNNAVAFRVRIRLVGEDLEKLMGLQADLAFTTEKKEHVVLVKNEALHSEGRNCFVYVPVPDKPRDEEKRPVAIGTTDGTFTEIVTGIADGDRIFIKRPQKTEKEKKASEQG